MAVRLTRSFRIESYLEMSSIKRRKLPLRAVYNTGTLPCPIAREPVPVCSKRLQETKDVGEINEGPSYLPI
jgi:hypothetical protein